MTKFLKFLGLGAERKAPAVEADVHPTEGEILAQRLARDFAKGNGGLPWRITEHYDESGVKLVVVSVELRGEEARQFQQSFDAARECQATSPRSHEDDCHAVG